MKLVNALFVVAALTVGMYTTGCTQSHTESDKTTLTGGHKHEETTTTKNPITGETSTSHTEQRTR